jgi:hypothetical protein
MKDLYVIALAPMDECPAGLEREWMKVVLQAMTNTFRLQCRPQASEDDTAHLAKLFDLLAAQWIDMRTIALSRGVALDPAQRAAVTVEMMRELFFEGEALNLQEAINRR